MAKKTSKKTMAKRKTMANKKRPTGVKKVQYHVSNTWQKPQFKTLYLVLFALVFGWIGYQAFFAEAEPPYPGGPDEIVAYYDQLGNYVATNNADGSTTNVLAPGAIVVTGDGTLYCNTDGNGAVTQSKLGLGELKQLLQDINNDEFKNLVAAQPSKVGAYEKADLSKVASLTLNATSGSQAASNVDGDLSGAFARSAAKLQKKCQNRGLSTRVQHLPDFKPFNEVDASRQVSWWQKLSPVAVASALTANKAEYTQNDKLTSLINNARTSRGITAYKYSDCVQRYYKNDSYHGAQTWSHHMIVTSNLAHNPNVVNIVTFCTYDSWTSYGENVGDGGFEIKQIFDAYMASPEHKSNILNKGFNRQGNGTWSDSKSILWTTSDFVKASSYRTAGNSPGYKIGEYNISD